MKLFIGIPSSRYYEPFWLSMQKFIPALEEIYQVVVFKASNGRISEVRNTIANMFMKSDCDYLLFLDDDHSGHTVEMFKAILDPIENNGALMCGVKSHAKYFPYNSNLLIYSGVNERELGLEEGVGRYSPVDLNSGYMYVDLVGFGMTILTRSAFEIVGEPYFISKNNGREDCYFCDKLVESGNRPVGYFGDTLEHNGISGEMASKRRYEGMAELKAKHPDMKVLVS